MTYTNTSERNILTVIAIASLFAVSAFAFAGVARADDFNYSEPYVGNSEAYANFSEPYTSNYSQSYANYSEPYIQNYSQPYVSNNYSEPYSNYSEPYASNYSEPYANLNIDPNAGTIDMNASTIDVNASSIDTYASSIDTNASSIYSTSYNVYSIPTYDYGYNSYGNSLAYGVGYGLGYAAMSYPYYTYQNYPVVASAPSNTSVYSPTSIVAPTNTCTAPNTCNTTVDDHSVVSAPTYAQPATAYVSPVVQTVPYYTAQAYVPSYSYSSPSYVYTNPAPYYAPVNPVVNPSPYVALTQIPYTGLDLGLFGNALYWIVLAGVALAGAYLLVYYLPSLKFLPALKLRQAGRQANSRGDPAEQQAVYGAGTLPARASTHAGGQSQGVTSPKVSEETPSKCEGVTSGTESHLRNIYRGTSDIMQVIKSAHGAAPRIVISRA